MRYHEIITEELATGTIKSQPTLTPDKARRRADRQQKIQQRIRDAQARTAKQITDLRIKLGKT